MLRLVELVYWSLVIGRWLLDAKIKVKIKVKAKAEDGRRTGIADSRLWNEIGKWKLGKFVKVKVKVKIKIKAGCWMPRLRLRLRLRQRMVAGYWLLVYGSLVIGDGSASSRYSSNLSQSVPDF